MKQPSVNAYSFNKVPQADIQRSTFDRSSSLKTTFDSDLLVPIYLDEVLPGDTFNMNMTGFARLATPINPTMDNAYLDVFWFFTPNRLVWDNWEKLMGAQDDPSDSTDFVVPRITDGSGFQTNSLGDYLGLPTLANRGDVQINALPFRMYNLIYNELFIDESPSLVSTTTLSCKF